MDAHAGLCRDFVRITESFGYDVPMDNNTAEICAVIQAAFWCITHARRGAARPIKLHVDNTYALAAVQALSAGPIVGPLLHIGRIASLAVQAKHGHEWEHVHAHQGNPWNELADWLSVAAGAGRLDDSTQVEPVRQWMALGLASVEWAMHIDGMDELERGQYPPRGDRGFVISPPVISEEQTLQLYPETDSCSRAATPAPGFAPSGGRNDPFDPRKRRNNCVCDIEVMSINVQTLKPQEKGESAAGRTAILQEELCDGGFALVGLQETRVKVAGMRSGPRFDMIDAPSDKGGNGGVALWISKELPFAEKGGKQIFLTGDDAVVAFVYV